MNKAQEQEEKSTLRARVRGGTPLAGTMSFTQSDVVIEAMASAGLDFVILDTEHSPTSVETVARLIRTADAAGIPALVRLASAEPHLIQVFLDAGATGIVVSVVETPSEARLLVESTRYRPVGLRGVCPMAREGRFRTSTWRAVMREHEESCVTIAIVETSAGLERIEEIAAVDGLDVVFLGPGDLSNSLGVPYGGFDQPEMKQALARAVAATEKHGKRIMTSVPPRPDYVGRVAAQRVSMFSYSSDNTLFHSMCRQVREIQDGLESR